ncbi:MAG: patatin-like phospholipase family protein [Dysgonamonadaceae bacterium]|jgi:predicted patatin/cPLA2 family phospholipase|nr:patatin-like phospholipase family protein [Dysgonamonadaceae bacterium]
MEKKAISCMSGGYKTVFTQGVLMALEEKSFFVDAYAGCSSSALISAYASIEKIRKLDLSLWINGLQISSIEGNSQSNAIQHSIDNMFPLIQKELWQPSSHRLLIAVSFVKTKEGELLTQTDKAKRFGQKLLIEASRNISTWRDENLELQMFDTVKDNKTKLLTENNFKEVAYATTRMLHAWHLPAYINGEAYIDGSYTCLYPVLPLLELGYKYIICILTEHDNRKYDMFSNNEISIILDDTRIDFIQPDMNLKDVGVDFYAATEKSLNKAFMHGFAKGIDYYKSIIN